jgi:DNA-binding response OmpR family regulator
MKKIFIFDAYSFSRGLLCEELAAEGNTVVAIGKLEDIKDSVGRLKPDLMILDLYVRGEIRWDLLIDLKAFHRQIPLLIFTGCLPPEDFRVHFADAWVRKSLCFVELKEKIIPLLEGFKDPAPTGKSDPDGHRAPLYGLEASS